ncbi:MAG: class I mannose-6-phosphate isomerase [Clostridia bacterium]|nr:class I mannose-6-phosphate isomerase [Clostridia bacterium]
MTKFYPLKLNFVSKSPIWGGVRLIREWNKETHAETVGESWELTVRSSEMNRVQNGMFAGKSLGELIGQNRDSVMGKSTGDAQNFPLLIKFIDAADRLSVQVHPDDAYAARVENDRGKTEVWYIVQADEGAEIICGLADGVTRRDYEKAVREGMPEAALRHQKVRAGETYFIPSGLPHAIGKGILIAEIQQNCDLTYRVYDYGRRDKDGNLRELHVEKALDVIRPFSDKEIETIRYERSGGRCDSTDVLADCRYFRVERVQVTGETPTELPACPYLRHLLCLDGAGELLCGAHTEPFAKGDSVLLPATLEKVVLRGAGSFLLSTAY